MKSIIKLEELTIFIVCSMLFYILPIPYYWFWILLFAPDISMLGYLFSNKSGAIIYNIFHHKSIAIILGLGGWYMDWNWITAIGIILLAHSSLDRVFGYGLKFLNGFQYTHLGKIGKETKHL